MRLGSQGHFIHVVSLQLLILREFFCLIRTLHGMEMKLKINWVQCSQLRLVELINIANLNGYLGPVVDYSVSDFPYNIWDHRITVPY